MDGFYTVADVNAWASFLAGFGAFLTPCVLPLVPFYLSYLAGSTVDDLRAENPDFAKVRMRAIINSIFFILGLLLVFVLLGATASAAGKFMAQNKALFRQISGIVLILVGIHFAGFYKFGILNRQARFQGPSVANKPWLAFLLGMAFAFGWTSCIGGLLIPIIQMAADSANVYKGMFYLGMFGLGMSLPFLFAAIFFSAFMRFYARFRPHFETFERIVGILLIIFGIMLLMNWVGYVANWMINWGIFGV